jgi:hypothetical protein
MRGEAQFPDPADNELAVLGAVIKYSDFVFSHEIKIC